MYIVYEKTFTFTAPSTQYTALVASARGQIQADFARVIYDWTDITGGDGTSYVYTELDGYSTKAVDPPVADNYLAWSALADTTDTVSNLKRTIGTGATISAGSETFWYWFSYDDPDHPQKWLMPWLALNIANPGTAYSGGTLTALLSLYSNIRGG